MREMLSDRMGGSAYRTHYQRRVKVHPRSVATLLTIIFSGSAFARVGNSAWLSDLESPRAVIGEQTSNLRARGASP